MPSGVVRASFAYERSLRARLGSKSLFLSPGSPIRIAVTKSTQLPSRSDGSAEATLVQTAVTNNYKHQASLLRQNGAAFFFDPSSPTNDPDLLGHPPGYPFLLALLYDSFGESDAAAQIFQIVCDSLAAAL